MSRDPIDPQDAAPPAPPDRSHDRARSAWSGNRPYQPRRTLSIKGALSILVLWIVVSGSGLAIQHIDMPPHLAFLGETAIAQVFAALGLMVAIMVFGWRDTALRAPQPGTGSLMWLPSLYLIAFAATIVALGTLSGQLFLGLVYSMFWISVSEELMFRGLLFPALRRQMQIWPAIGLTCALFGAIHLMNALADGDVIGAAIQTLAATMTGFLLLAIRLRRGSLWPAVWYHMAWNIGVFGLGFSVQTDAEPASGPLGTVAVHSPMTVAFLFLLVLPNALYAAWLLRHAHRQSLPGDVV